MLLNLLLGAQLIFNTSAMPNDHLGIEDQSNHQNSSVSVLSEKDDLASLIQRYTAYNHWADQQLAAWLSTASEEDLDREIESSYSSLKETIFHIWNAEYLWLQMVQGESADDSPAKGFQGNKEELFKAWLQTSENFKTYAKSLSVTDLQSSLPSSTKDAGGLKILDMIHHCMNHSTYHRGQLITMGRQVGLESPPRTDYLYYVRLYPVND